MTFSSRWLTYLTIFVVLMSIAMPAFAGPFDPPAGDQSKKIFIDHLFGPLTGGGDSPFSAVIKIFNQAMLLVGGILVAYTLIAGTMSTAHDGQMLGKSWSSMWIPIRTALGTAAILPVLPGGFCAAQGAVVWLALQGVGLADRLVNAFVSESALFDTAIEPPAVHKPIRQLLETMLVSNTCVSALNADIKRIDETTVNGFGMADVAGGLTVQAQGYLYGRGGMCGSVFIPQIDANAGKIGGGAAWGISSTIFDTTKYAALLSPVHSAQLASAQAKIEVLADKVANGNEDDLKLAEEVRTTLDSIAKEWSTQLYTTAKAAIPDQVNEPLMQSIRHDGWLMLGSWYMEIAKAQDSIARGVTSVPNGTMPADGMGGVAGAAGGRPIMNAFRSLLSLAKGAGVDEAMARARFFANRNTVAGTGGAVEELAENNTNTWTAKIVSWFINDENNMFGENIGQNMNQNPVIMARNLGQNMTMAGWAGYGATAVVGSIWPGVAAMISPMVTAIAGTIIVAGATLSTYVPMLPYILWIGVVLGWAILLVEAVIAAPLWAVTHLAPDGDGVVGRGGQGYMLVLSLVLRPALIVLGFVCAVILMEPLGIFINSTFIGTFLNGVNPSVFGLSQMVMGCVLYTVVMISVITRVFSLIHIVPDKILRWIGGGAADLGETAHGIESHTSAKVMAGAAASQTLGSAMTTGAQNLRSNRLQSDQALQSMASGKAQELGNRQDLHAKNQNEIQQGIDDARQSTSQEGLDSASKRLDVLGRDNAISSFNTSVAAAESASARGKTSRATPQEIEMAKSADAFLAKARGINPYEVGADGQNNAESFISNNANKFANTPWGNTLTKSVLDRKHMADTLNEIRANFKPPKPPGGEGDELE